MSDLRSQNSDVRCQISDVRSQKSDLRCQMSELRCQNSDLRCQMSDLIMDFFFGSFQMEIGEIGMVRTALRGAGFLG